MTNRANAKSAAADNLAAMRLIEAIEARMPDANPGTCTDEDATRARMIRQRLEKLAREIGAVS